MRLSRLLAALLGQLFLVLPAQAQHVFVRLPDGAWKWYYAVFSDVGSLFHAPDIFSGSATVRIRKFAVQIEMQQLEPKDTSAKPPVFTGKIDALGRITGEFDGILMEDPRPMVGYIHRMHWDRGPCVTETIVLHEKDSREDALVFRRGVPSDC
jgi:hypothetical protein